MARFASPVCAGYHELLMPVALRKLLPTFLAALLLLIGLSPATADDIPAIFPLSQVQPGMKGVAYTIFTGDEIEKVDLVVLGVLHNAIGPKQDVILVQLLGEKVEHTGVVAGISGSPVYFDGKLAGALSLKLGVFTKEAIGGVTPIENMLAVENAPEPPANVAPQSYGAGAQPTNTDSTSSTARIPLPENFARQTSAGAGQFLVPIETPLITTGLYPETIAQFSKQLSAWGMTMMAGGTAAPSPEDAQLKPGDMVGVELIRGDLSITPGCTVTTVNHGKILACGHPIFFIWQRLHAAGARACGHYARFRHGFHENHLDRRHYRNSHARSRYRHCRTSGRRTADDPRGRHSREWRRAKTIPF